MTHRTRLTRNSMWAQTYKPQFVERDEDISTLLGFSAVKAGTMAAAAALVSAFLVIPAVFMAASKNSDIKTAGVWLGYAIWSVFVLETMVFIRLEKGWGGKWLKKHWLQLIVIVLASPLTAIVIEDVIMPMVSVLFSLQNFITVAYFSKIFSSLKIVKLLHLEEVRQKIGKATKRITWLYRTTVVSIAFCSLGIVGAAAQGGAPTPVHGLELWLELAQQSLSAAPELFLVSIPLVVVIGGFALLQARWSTRLNRR